MNKLKLMFVRNNTLNRHFLAVTSSINSHPKKMVSSLGNEFGYENQIRILDPTLGFIPRLMKLIIGIFLLHFLLKLFFKCV